MVRATSADDAIEGLESQGVELVYGDLKDAASLEVACAGVEAVLSTASATLPSHPDDTLESVDRDGQIALVGAAALAGVERFVFVSHSPNDLDSPSAAMKDAVEVELRESDLNFTILRPAHFMDVWFSPAVGFDLAARSVRIYGSGEETVSWIAASDVAEFAIRSLDSAAAGRRTFELGGPEPLSQLEVVDVFEGALGEKLELEFISTSELEAMRQSAPDSLTESYAAFSLECSRGCEIDTTEALEAVPMSRMSVRDYVANFVRIDF